MGKTLMMIELYNEIEEVEVDELKKTKEFKQLINHPRVYLDDKKDELYYFEEDTEELEFILPETFRFTAGYDVAFGFDDAGYFYKVDDITLEGETLVDAIKEEMELLYHQNIKPSYSMESLGKSIMVKHIEKILNNLKSGDLTVEI